MWPLCKYVILALKKSCCSCVLILWFKSRRSPAFASDPPSWSCGAHHMHYMHGMFYLTKACKESQHQKFTSKHEMNDRMSACFAVMVESLLGCIVKIWESLSKKSAWYFILVQIQTVLLRKKFFPCCDVHCFSSLLLKLLCCATCIYVPILLCFSFVVFPGNWLLSIKYSSLVAAVETILVSFVKICV